MRYLSDGSWLNEPEAMDEAEARRLVIAELGGIWTETRVDGAAFCASIMVRAWNAGDLSMHEAEALLRFAAGAGPKPTWLP